MKMVIYWNNSADCWCVTPEKNYRAYVQNAREIHRMTDFESPEEIIDYFCKWCKSTPEDFTIIR